MSLPLFDAKNDTFSSICSDFIRKFSILSFLRDAGARKLRGVPVSRIFGFLFSSVFANGSSFHQQKFLSEDGDIPSYRGTNRFLSSEKIDWNMVTAGVAASIIASELEPIHEKEMESGRKCWRCLVADDTPFRRDRSKEVEKAVKCYDHADHSYYNGYRDIHVAYTDGLTTIPISHCLMSSYEEGSNERCRMHMNDALFDMIGDAKATGIKADYLLFDSWYGTPKDIRRGVEKGYNVICMVKKAKTRFVLEDGRKLTVKAIFSSARKRRGRSRYLLSSVVTLPDSDQKARLVFVRNRSNRKDWLVLLSTDLDLSEDDVIACYANRWNIEAFFKNYKQDLRAVSRCRARKYSVINANCAIAMLQYMILALEKRIQTDPRTLGELFVSMLDEGTEEAVFRVMEELCSIFVTEMARRFDIDEEELRNALLDVVNAFLSSFNVSLERAA